MPPIFKFCNVVDNIAKLEYKTSFFIKTRFEIVQQKNFENTKGTANS